MRGIGIGSNLQGSDFPCPGHHSREITGQPGLDQRHRPFNHLTRGSIQSNRVQFLKLNVSKRALFSFYVNLQSVDSGNARLAHRPGHHCGMRSHASSGGQDSLRHAHSMNILRRCFRADKNDLFFFLSQFLGTLGSEYNFSCRRTGGGAQAFCQQFQFCFGVNHRMKDLIQLICRNPHQGFPFTDQPLVHHIDRHFDGRGGCAFTSPGLQ